MSSKILAVFGPGPGVFEEACSDLRIHRTWLPSLLSRPYRCLPSYIPLAPRNGFCGGAVFRAREVRGPPLCKPLNFDQSRTEVELMSNHYFVAKKNGF